MKKILLVIIVLLSLNKHVFANEPITGLLVMYHNTANEHHNTANEHNNTANEEYYNIFPGTFIMQGEKKIRTVSFYVAESVKVDNSCHHILLCEQKIIKGKFIRFTFNIDNVSIKESSS